MTTIKGTENQIRFAQDILSKFNKVIELGLSKSSKPEHISFLNDFRTEINALESASVIIERSKDSSLPTNISELADIMRNKFSK
jgi:hypothetical protein